MTSKLKVLCLSFWTPPIVRPQSILIGKMIPEWTKQGIRPVVVTYDICGDWNIGVPVYKIPVFKESGAFLKVPILNKLARLRNEYKYFKKLSGIAEEIIKKYDINLIFSFSNPQESNILGAMLKKKLGIPFVSHFSDPWTDNSYKHFSGFGGIKARLQEKFIIENSSGILFTNRPALELVMKKYPAALKGRTAVVPHCFDASDYPAKGAKKENGKFTFSYIGAFYKQRNPELFFGALDVVFKKHPELKQKTALKLVGIESDYTGYNIENVKQMLADYGLDKIADIVPAVGYKESLKYMTESDCLLVIDADFKNSPFFPSKAVDYAGSGTPIIGITPAGSPTSLFLERLGYQPFNYQEADKMREFIEKILVSGITPNVKKDVVEFYEVKSTTAKLLRKFNEIVNEEKI